jgi:hypothetical protein
MEVIRLDRLKSIVKDGVNIVSFIVNNGKDDFPIEIKSKTELRNDCYDFMLPIVLYAAMKEGKNLHIDGNVSSKLMSNVPAIQDIFHDWYPQYKKVQVTCAGEYASSYTGNNEVGCFFTAGVDSSYTLLKHINEITRLIFLDNCYDHREGNEEIMSAHVQHLKRLSERLGIPFIEISSNMRDFMDKYGIWGNHNHGAAFASIALLLSNHCKKIYIASSDRYSDLAKWGSHPLLDPLWSNESMTIVHDGCEASRINKVKFIAQNEILVSSLRVCFHELPNCGRCEKCIRTWIELRIANALDKCQDLFVTQERFVPYHIARLRTDGIYASAKGYMRENIQGLIEKGGDPEILEALKKSLNGYYYKRIIGFPRRVFSYICERIRRTVH